MSRRGYLIGLEMGRSNDIKNLCRSRTCHDSGARQKDALENWLHQQVCSGKMLSLKYNA
jgi:hypothetical protein